MPDERKISTWQLLKSRFPDNEYVLIHEVQLGNRFLDFMAINLWNSRGYAITGIERKSNRGDWLKEMKNPVKQETHFKFCDYFYLLTDKEDVAKKEEIPHTWGWLHICPKGVLRTMKKAPKLKPKVCGRDLISSMLRRAACKKDFVHCDSIEDTINSKSEEIYKIRTEGMEEKIESYEALLKNVQLFNQVTGINLMSGRWHSEEVIQNLGNAVNLVMRHDLKSFMDDLKRFERTIANIHDGVNSGIEELANYCKSETSTTT
jgi:hypothetical protein